MTLWVQTLSLALVLFLYGYALSTAGHDHAAHQEEVHEHDLDHH